MPWYIKDETTSLLVAELARKRGLTKQAAVRLAVTAELRRDDGPSLEHDELTFTMLYSYFASNLMAPRNRFAIPCQAILL